MTLADDKYLWYNINGYIFIDFPSLDAAVDAAIASLNSPYLYFRWPFGAGPKNKELTNKAEIIEIVKDKGYCQFGDINGSFVGVQSHTFRNRQDEKIIKSAQEMCDNRVKNSNRVVISYGSSVFVSQDGKELYTPWETYSIPSLKYFRAKGRWHQSAGSGKDGHKIKSITKCGKEYDAESCVYSDTADCLKSVVMCKKCQSN